MKIRHSAHVGDTKCLSRPVLCTDRSEGVAWIQCAVWDKGGWHKAKESCLEEERGEGNPSFLSLGNKTSGGGVNDEGDRGTGQDAERGDAGRGVAKGLGGERRKDLCVLCIVVCGGGGGEQESRIGLGFGARDGVRDGARGGDRVWPLFQVWRTRAGGFKASPPQNPPRRCGHGWGRVGGGSRRKGVCVSTQAERDARAADLINNFDIN